MSIELQLIKAISGCAALWPDQAAGLVAGSTLAVGREIGNGAFGTVYACTGIGGRTIDGLVVKRHLDNSGVTPEQCASVLAALHAAVDARWGSASDIAHQHLTGLPFWVGRARWGADEVVVSVSLNLVELGYQPFDPILEDPKRLGAWLALDIGDRLQMALAFARSHAMCEEMEFVHADINVENVFVDPGRRRATLIDFDSGSLPGSPNRGPLTWGKPDDFVAPEAKKGGRLDPSAIGLLTDRWAVTWMIHYLLFGVGPLFFLAQLSTPAISDYLATFSWPDIDHNSPMINHPNRAFYSRFLQELAEVPPATVEMFRQFVTIGALDPSRRPSSAEWCAALDAVTVAPKFESVALSANVTLDLSPIQIAWSAPGADTVTIGGEGTFPGRGRTQMLLRRSGPIRLVARNAFGMSEYETEPVTVLRGPQIQVPEMPVVHLCSPSPHPCLGDATGGYRFVRAAGTLALAARTRCAPDDLLRRVALLPPASVRGPSTATIGARSGPRRGTPRPIGPPRSGWPVPPDPTGAGD